MLASFARDAGTPRLPRRTPAARSAQRAKGRGCSGLPVGRPALRVISVIEEPDVIEKVLRHLGLPPVPLDR